MAAHRPLVVVANTRVPSERAQALQVCHAAAAFARRGKECTLLVARRRGDADTGLDPFDWYGVPAGPRPALERVACIDWIEAVPRALQFPPARLQEASFARHAARRVRSGFPDALVLARELEVARALVRAGHSSVLLEVHRVPGGKLRRKWLLEGAAGALGVIAISEGVRDDLVALGVDASAVLVEHDALEPERVRADLTRAEARAALGVDAQRPLVVYTGGLLEWKGVDDLVEAARSVPDVQFLLAGGMPADVERVRASAAGLENVRVDGFQAPERVGLYLRAADVGVVPNRSKPAISARYTSPLKVFEAMAVGLPLIASDLPSMRAVLTHDVDAWLAPAEDPAALASAIERLVGDEGLRERLGSALAERAPAHTYDARAERILDWAAARARLLQNE